MSAVALVPLDDRPVSRDLPGEIASMAGVEVLLPGVDATPHRQRVPPPGALSRWYHGVRGRSDSSVVSLDALSFGSLIGSRTGNQTVREALAAWVTLESEGPEVYAAVVVPRAPDTDDPTEEPAYWYPHGPALHRLSGRLAHGHDDLAVARRAVAPDVPAHVTDDWTRRRLRQHALALAAVDLQARGALTSLVVGVDDAVGASLSTRAQADLERWVDIVGRGADVLVHHGADETGAVLMARAVRSLLGAPAPRVALACAAPDGLRRVATYETGPVGHTAARQLCAAGALVVADPDAADVVLVVHPPSVGEAAGDWALAPPRASDDTAARATVDLLRWHRDAGRRVAAADVGQPNGADTALAALLGRELGWSALDGYAAWNTAGNTLGTVAAQLVAAAAGRAAGTFDAAAQHRAITRRAVEDLGWMSHVRTAVRKELGTDFLRHDTVDLTPDRRADWEARLDTILADSPGLDDLAVVPDSLTLPWGRTFEIDLAIVDRRQGAT